MELFSIRIQRTFQLVSTPIEARTYKSSHDRFLIIDNTEVYHIGASLKDLGKKMFAFSKLELPAHTIIDVL